MHTFSLRQKLAKNLRSRQQTTKKGFTIVELLIVIVIIGILAAVTIVAYNGVTQRANEASLASDLNGASMLLATYRIDNGTYPTSNDCTVGLSPAPPRICLHVSGSNILASYTVDTSLPGSPHYKLIITNGGGSSYVTDDQGPTKSPATVAVTGGVTTVDGAYTVRTFMSSGTLTVSNGTLTNVSVLAIGGGGGGDQGGGGGGQFLALVV